MSNVGQRERQAQDRVVRLFQDGLDYDYLGNWEYRAGNANVEVELLTQNLRARGYDDALINKAVHKLRSDASLGGGRNLYEANRDVYGLLRYGVKVKPGVGEATETVWLIDWARPEANHFALAEEVTVLGQLKAEIAHYVDVRAEVKIAASEDVDFKQYEAGMRHLLDTYISAKPSETISNFENAGLIELIVRLGAGVVDKLPAVSRATPRRSLRPSPTTCAS